MAMSITVSQFTERLLKTAHNLFENYFEVLTS